MTNPYLLEQRKRCEALARFATGLAEALGDGWREDTADADVRVSQYVRHDDGRALHLCNSPSVVSADRVCITGVIDGRPVSIRDQDQITVSMKAMPPVVALAVRRRLLPQYEERLAVARAAVRKEAAIQAERDQVAGMLRDAHPGLIRQVQGRPAGAYTLAYSYPTGRNDHARVRAEVTDTVPGVRVDLHLGNLMPEAAVAVLAALRAA